MKKIKKCKILFLPAARQDLKDIKAYYRKINPLLLSRFILELDLFVNKIEDWPQFAAVRYGNIRIVNLKKFPYALHYYYDQATKTAIVNGVFHTASDPGKGLLRDVE